MKNGEKLTAKVFVLMLFTSWYNICWATPWLNAFDFLNSGETTYICGTAYDAKISLKNGATIGQHNQCTLNIGPGNSVPVTASNYSVVVYATTSPGAINSNYFIYQSYNFSLVADKQLNQQAVTIPTREPFNIGKDYSYICYLLARGANHYTLNNTPQSCISGGTPLPPGPNYLQCSFNHGNDISVTMGDIERSTIGTLPDTIPSTDVELDVTCTGDGSSTFSISFKYTPFLTSGNEYIESSVNGLAIAMSLNDTLVDTVTTYNRTYKTGSQTEKLRFEPMRDPSVKYTDIPTGAFTASAVMIITQE
ncbi:hypothetical protein [Enterobacter wuhouensis]|uniref:hypothetical protein n=1 Tax=Enterobacter wuhouensis TaxID=2529381 RepID=UPI003D77CF5E